VRWVFAVGIVLLLAAAAPASTSKLHGNNFYANCRFSHTSNDDPIVYPNEPGRSHHHTFFGNRSTDADSTPATLRGARTTCKPSTDTAAYWVPTLYRRGVEVRPAKGQFYYNLRGYDRLRAFPAGLRLIAGDAHAHTPQSTRVVYWTCGGRGGVRLKPSATVPARCPVVRATFTAQVKACPGCKLVWQQVTSRVQTFLELHVNYPDCWDGVHLDSPDHKSHMAHSRDYVCPASHPVKVPLIRLMIRYPLTDGEGVTLASGGQLTGHADFINAWDQRVLERLVATCFHDRPCDPAKAR
jgi:Domain of unknown function (DUF1996)